MEFNRRDFIKGTLALGSIAAVGGLAGCSSPQNQSPDSSPLADTGSIPGIPESFTDGKWIGTAMGHDDDLIVEVVVAGGDLASVRVLRCDDTIGIGTTAAPIMASRILETKNLDVDTVTGATTTSIAVRNAVADAITNAGGSVSSFSLGTTAPTGGAPQNLEVDVALAGAGTAGLIAAVRLLEAGKSVVLFEKQDIAGGSMPMTYSGVAAAESQLQSNYALGRHDENPMFNKAGMLAVMSKYLVPENDRFNGAMPYQTAMYDNSGKLVDWLHGMGVGFYSLGVNPAYGVMLLGKQWRLIDDSRTTGSESRLHELRERMLAGEALSDGDAVLTYTIQTEPISGFTLLLSQPRVFNREMTHLMVLVGVTLGAVSLLLCLWGALVLSRQVTRPVREMTAAMKRVQLGELSARVVPRGEGEMGQLAVGFNQMVAECELNLRRSVERQKELNDTRIRMMQSQLNPHFLYNTLDSMKWMGVTHGVPQVATLAEDLAKILRASISGDEFVTLGQELELLERYIDIQLIRFEDRFACEIEVDDALMGCMVPKLVLQPIVENAVIHGVRDMDDGYIKIWAEADAGDLRLFVQDNGRGMEKPQDGPLGFGVSGRPGEHLGMFNVDSILRLHFGDAYGLSVRSRPGEGCLVMVRLPMRREKA